MTLIFGLSLYKYLVYHYKRHILCKMKDLTLIFCDPDFLTLIFEKITSQIPGKIIERMHWRLRILI